MNKIDYETIRLAIINKHQITALYNGKVREFCPHVIGTKDGKAQLLGYQFGGESTSKPIEPTGSPANWRCMPLEGLTNIKSVPGVWHTCDQHSKRQTCVDIVDVEVS